MRSKSILSIVALGIACFSSMLYAEWIPLVPNSIGRVPQINLMDASFESLTLSVSVPGVELEIINTDDMIRTTKEEFALLSFPGYYHTSAIGRPKLPVIRKTIGIPYAARIEIEVTRVQYKDVHLSALGIEQRIIPVLASVLKMPGEKPVFELDTKVYTRNAFYPDDLVRIEREDIMRGHRLATIEIVPLAYNPVTRTIRYYTDVEISVRFIDGDIALTRENVVQDYSPVYESYFAQRMLNYSLYETLLRDVLPLPIRYLIITHNNFTSQISSLAQWLHKKGFIVKVANQDSISPWTTTGIENYIDAQSPAPSYLLLVGDVNGGYMPAPNGSSSGAVTDLYYAELDGSGYLPDIFYGRLSCENSTHITTMVDKILKYEKANLPSGWFKDDAFCAGTDNYTVSEGTHNYCTSTFMDPNGYTTHKLYMVTYGATTADVTNNVNDGRILITMSGHGNVDGWHDGPQFLVSNVNALSNGDKLTIATGHCCLANNFGSSTNPCGGESWVRKSGGGGVAYYGSCPSTYWNEDDWLQREWYEAIYADEIYEHGRFTQDGMYDGVEMSGSTMKRYYYEAYHVMGDPSLDLWTEAPAPMTVNHNSIVFPGAGNFTVTAHDGATPLQNALVCCWIPQQSPEMHVAAYTNTAGSATLSVSPTTPGDTMYVTVTRHNYIPYEGYAMVSSPSGPYVTLGLQIINDSGGDGQVNPGETVDFGIWAKNVGVDPAYGVYGLLAESDPYVSLTTDSSWYSTIPAGDSSLSNPYYHFSIASNCPNSYGLSFDLEFHDNNDSTWVSHPTVTVYAPVLTYQDNAIVGGNGNGVLDPGETCDVVVTIENEGGAVAPNVTSTLLCVSPYITINDNSGNYGTINPGNQASNSADPYNVTASGTTPTGTTVNFQVVLVSGVYCDTVGFSIVVGRKHYYLWNADPTPTPGENCHAILGTLGYAGDYGTSLAPDLSLYQAVLVCVGIYASNYVIPDGGAEATALTNFLQTMNGRMYLEGGDVWYYDPLIGGHDFGPLFGINATGDGSSDMGPVEGQSGTFTNGMYFTYGGENYYMDHISATGTGFLIFRDVTPGYDCGVANDASTYRTVGTSFELGLLTDGTGVSTRAALLDSIMKFFGIIIPGVEEAEGLTGLPLKTQLSALYPNPGVRQMQVAYQLAQPTGVQLVVYDAAGRLVRTLCDAVQEPGYYAVRWNGCDDAGRAVSAGVYFVRFETNSYERTEKAILLR